jgi:hypothetical protein
MSSPVDAAQSWVNEYQARFGTVPAMHDAKSELENCVQMCQDLIGERDRLRAQLAQVEAERDQYRRSLSAMLAKDYRGLALDKETVFAQMVKKPTLAEVIADLEREQEG